MGMLYRLISRFCVLLHYLGIMSNFAHTWHYLRVIQTTLLILALKSYINETTAHNSTLRCQPRCTRSNTPSRRNNNACTSKEYKLLPCLFCVRDVTNTCITLANQLSLFRVGRSLLVHYFVYYAKVLRRRRAQRDDGEWMDKQRYNDLCKMVNKQRCS